MQDPLLCEAPCWKNQAKNFQDLLKVQVATCKEELKSKNCDAIPDTDERKLCHPSQFCRGEDDNAMRIIEGCGFGLVDPTLKALEGLFTVPYAIFKSLADSAILCATEPSCGIPNLSAERKEELLRNLKDYLSRLEAMEREEEATLCKRQISGFGCPLPAVSCREWDRILVQGKTAGISQKDGFNKGQFCKAVINAVGQRRISDLNSDARKAAEAVQLWFRNYQQRYPCFQAKYVLAEACKALGTLGTFYSLPLLFSNALFLASRGLSALEISKLLESAAAIKSLKISKASSRSETFELSLKRRAETDLTLRANLEKAGEILPEILKLGPVKAEKIIESIGKLSPDELKILKEEARKPDWRWCL